MNENLTPDPKFLKQMIVTEAVVSGKQCVKIFSPYIIQSKRPAQILTDSRLQAYMKLCCGEYSASSRVTSFLSTVSEFQTRVRHIAGQANLPSDYASENPLKCID